MKTVCSRYGESYDLISQGKTATCKKAGEKVNFSGTNLTAICVDPKKMCAKSTKCPDDCNHR